MRIDLYNLFKFGTCSIRTQAGVFEDNEKFWAQTLPIHYKKFK